MTGVILLGREQFAHGLADSASHIFGHVPVRLSVVAVDELTPEALRGQLQDAITALSDDGVLILADIFGASHTNVACTFCEPGRVELVAGANLPMLVRLLNHRDLPLTKLLHKALSGGSDGIICNPRRGSNAA